MLKIVSNYEIPYGVHYLTGCSASGGARSGTSNDPNKKENTGSCESLSINDANPNKDPNYCGYKH